jgi:hypothetical protein
MSFSVESFLILPKRFLVSALSASLCILFLSFSSSSLYVL